MKSMFNARDLAITQASAAALLFLSIPLFNLIGFSNHKLEAVLHGLGATITVIMSCQVLHLTYPMLRGKKGAAVTLERVLWLTNILVLITIILGNWLYISYRGPDGPQQWLMYRSPEAHLIVMEYKEFVSLYPLPLGIAAAVLLRRFRHALEAGSAVSGLIALLITLFWICLLLGLAFGFGLTKLKMV
ncbi:hypothetical protein I8J29_09810 [Paenibacillus sp. MWE-103]|uniref:Uncharacterized protein n=1 Tax=Paenibacillus artemisiicola TaxID=1172618 RepID=A0ABS3W8I0_9BACL|nr:hypothetical protein [Paenibacillus artemisiicola]MBO7744491.1 hypothetical protein [Paenibacillus artemisiicola]